MIHFTTSFIEEHKCRVNSLESAQTHYRNDRENIIPIDDSEEIANIVRLDLISIKRAGELIDRHLLPNEFLDFVLDKKRSGRKMAKS